MRTYALIAPTIPQNLGKMNALTYVYKPNHISRSYNEWLCIEKLLILSPSGRNGVWGPTGKPLLIMNHELVLQDTVKNESGTQQVEE